MVEARHLFTSCMNENDIEMNATVNYASSVASAFMFDIVVKVFEVRV